MVIIGEQIIHGVAAQCLLRVTQYTTSDIPGSGWVIDLDRGVEIVVDVACLGFKVGNGYG